MSQPTIVLACPTCKHTCRTQRETRPGAKMRCPGCNGVFSFFVHGNGAVELRPVDDEPATGSRLPPRTAEQGETQGTRTIFTSRRRNRPIGGYAPFGKSRSYIGTFAVWIVLGLGSLTAYVYFNHIDTMGKAMGKRGNNAFQAQDEAKRKDFQARQKKALENLKKQQTNVQSDEAKVEDGRLPGDQAPEDEAKRKDFQERQKRALEKLKKQPTNVQPGGAKVEDGRLPGDQTHD